MITVLATLTSHNNGPWCEVYEETKTTIRKYVCHDKNKAFAVAEAWQRKDYSTRGKLRVLGDDNLWHWQEAA